MWSGEIDVPALKGSARNDWLQLAATGLASEVFPDGTDCIGGIVSRNALHLLSSDASRSVAELAPSFSFLQSVLPLLLHDTG